MKKMKQAILTAAMLCSVAIMTESAVASQLTTGVGIEFTDSSEPTKPIEPTVPSTTPKTPSTSLASAGKQLVKLPQTGEQSEFRQTKLIGVSLVLVVGIVLFERKRRCSNSENKLFDD